VIDAGTKNQAQVAAREVPTPPIAQKSGTRRRALLVHGTQLGVLVVMLGSWELLASSGHLDPVLFGQPSGIVGRLSTWITQGTSLGSLGQQIAVTLEEAFIGFFIGTALGIVSGIALGRVRFLADVFGPFIKVLNSVPRIVLGSVFVLMFGLGLESKILLVIVLVFFGVFFNAFQGTREVDRNFIANAAILGASKWQITRQVVLPSAFTWIMASLHISFGFALIGALVGELLGADKGLGLLIKNSQNNTDINGVLAGMVLVAVIALVAETLITLLEKRVLRWRPPQNSADLSAV
jgi:NitT/TauT family transport system permease protein